MRVISLLLPLGFSFIAAGCATHELDFPTGKSERLQINGLTRSGSSPYLVADRPPAAIKARRYAVWSSQATVHDVLQSWASTAGVKVDWAAEVDYPITPRISEIREDTLGTALDRLRIALQGVEKPLHIELNTTARVVRVSAVATAEDRGQWWRPEVQPVYGHGLTAEPVTAQAPAVAAPAGASEAPAASVKEEK